MHTDEISTILTSLSPNKRVKYLRQRVLKLKQQTFCEDGIIREGTLKSIEIERMKIGPKIAERLVHKFSLEGILCEKSAFLEQEDHCVIHLDLSKKELFGEAMSSLEEMRQKVTRLTPISITTNEYYPFIPAQSILLGRELNTADLKELNKTLCYIQGSKSSLYYLSYINKKELKAEIKDQQITLSTTIMDFCTLFIIEIIYLGT